MIILQENECSNRYSIAKKFHHLVIFKTDSIIY